MFVIQWAHLCAQANMNLSLFCSWLSHRCLYMCIGMYVHTCVQPCVLCGALWSLDSCIHSSFSSFHRQQAHYASLNCWRSEGWMRAGRETEGTEREKWKQSWREGLTSPKRRNNAWLLRQIWEEGWAENRRGWMMWKDGYEIREEWWKKRGILKM